MEIVVTGASRGLGKAIAFRLAPLASRMWLCASSDSPHLKGTVAAIAAAHPRLSTEKGTLHVVHFDALRLWDAQHHPGSWGNVLKEKGCAPDLLVNNAGGYAPSTLADGPADGLRHMLAQNLLAAHDITRALLPALIERKGTILNIVSAAAVSGISGAMDYGIAKHGALGFSRNLREELRGTGVRVTAVLPGTMNTERWQEPGDPRLASEKGEGLTADDVADMVLATVTLGKGANVEEIIIQPV
ncbi:hypothetical protein DFJ74DRAFT_657879 [Hyaloraphidium curvatum]|nr:hypothetical protein DFJ74DRAFT_657879 [Hyaloraphidium curvatum]